MPLDHRLDEIQGFRIEIEPGLAQGERQEAPALRPNLKLSCRRKHCPQQQQQAG